MGRRLLMALTCLAIATGAAHAELPASEETAKARLETSPRHGELMTIDVG